MVYVTLATFWKGRLSNFQMFSIKRCWLYLYFKCWLEIACPRSVQVVIILWTVFSSNKQTNSRHYLPSNHWRSAISMGLFISLVITANQTTKNNIFVVLLVVSVMSVVYLLLFSQVSSWITNGHQRPTKILLVRSSGRQKGPVCSSRFYLPETVPPLQGAIYTTTSQNFFPRNR